MFIDTTQVIDVLGNTIDLSLMSRLFDNGIDALYVHNPFIPLNLYRAYMTSTGD